MKLSIAMPLFLGFLFAGCSPRPAARQISGDTLAAGEELYNQNCALCHLDGKGSDLNPPLIGSEVVAGENSAALVRIMLRGQKGPITVAGKAYDGIMPAQDFLTDEEVAAVAAYVRKTFGQKVEAVTADEVARARAETR